MSDAAFPAFTIPGYAQRSGNRRRGTSYRFQTPILDQQILESLSWYRGKHAFKFGAEYRAGANDEIRDRGSAGNFTISPLITGPAGRLRHGQRAGQLPARRGQRGQHPGLRQDSLARLVPGVLRAGRLARHRSPDDQRRPALGGGIAAPRGRQQDEFVRPAGDQSGVRHARRGDVRRRERRSGARFRHRQEQFRTARWDSPTGCPAKRETVIRGGGGHLLRPDRQQHHRRRGVAGLLDLGQLRRVAGRNAERAAAARRLPGGTRARR